MDRDSRYDQLRRSVLIQSNRPQEKESWVRIMDELFPLGRPPVLPGDTQSLTVPGIRLLCLRQPINMRVLFTENTFQ